MRTSARNHECRISHAVSVSPNRHVREGTFKVWDNSREVDDCAIQV